MNVKQQLATFGCHYNAGINFQKKKGNNHPPEKSFVCQFENLDTRKSKTNEERVHILAPEDPL